MPSLLWPRPAASSASPSGTISAQGLPSPASLKSPTSQASSGTAAPQADRRAFCPYCGAQDEVLALLFGFDLLQAVELAQQRAPLGLQSRRGGGVFQRPAQHRREQ